MSRRVYNHYLGTKEEQWATHMVLSFTSGPERFELFDGRTPPFLRSLRSYPHLPDERRILGGYSVLWGEFCGIWRAI